MLTVEKEMIELLMKGARNPTGNMQIAFFLVAWSSSLLAVARMAIEDKKEEFIQAEGLSTLIRDYARRVEAETKTEERNSREF